MKFLITQIRSDFSYHFSTINNLSTSIGHGHAHVCRHSATVTRRLKISLPQLLNFYHHPTVESNTISLRGEKKWLRKMKNFPLNFTELLADSVDLIHEIHRHRRQTKKSQKKWHHLSSRSTKIF